MNKETMTKGILNYQAIGEQIPHDLGIKMIKDHYIAHTVGASHSFIIGRDIIENVLAQPGCVGIHMYEAVNEIGQKTLVSVGIDSTGKNILELASVNEHGKIVVTEGLVFDKIWGPSHPSTAPSADDNPFTVD
jgi:hypothetical protein